jgi:hypothetical protein
LTCVADVESVGLCSNRIYVGMYHVMYYGYAVSTLCCLRMIKTVPCTDKLKVTTLARVTSSLGHDEDGLHHTRWIDGGALLGDLDCLLRVSTSRRRV